MNADARDTGSDLSSRYGTPTPRRRRFVAIVVAVVVALPLAWFVWAYWLHPAPALDAGVAAYEVTGEHEIRIKVQFRADDDVHGACVYRASAQDHTVVGERTITVEEMRAAAGGWLAIRTERRATMVEQLRCTTS